MSSVKTVETLLTELGLHERASRVAENVWTLQKGSATVQIVAAKHRARARPASADARFKDSDILFEFDFAHACSCTNALMH